MNLKKPKSKLSGLKRKTKPDPEKGQVTICNGRGTDVPLPLFFGLNETEKQYPTHHRFHFVKWNEGAFCRV